MSRLLVMACSATKSSQALPVPAVDRYTGPIWQTLKAADPTGALAHVTVLSAEHGWITGSAPICRYNRKMDNVRGRELIARGATAETLAMLGEATGYGRRPFFEVCIVGGHYYQEVARELLQLTINRSGNQFFRADVRVVEICDQIGYMRQRLRSWLVGTKPLQVAA